ncbi:hypothetical protein [Rheinheimera aquimaris]|uniref:hypothetical protein n=1 Tax=Rheinheimera aquimaris TaxID=412437 RepID=UPI003A96A790
MKLEIKHPKQEPIRLPASEYLEATKEEITGVPEEGIRHPLATYNISVLAVISTIKDLLEDLERAFPLEGKQGSDRVLAINTLKNKTKQFILAMGEHIDACEKVIYCYLRTSEKGKVKKAKDMLRKNLGWYEKHVMTQANHIKHRHSQIRNLCMHNLEHAVPGYFIESAIGPKAVGPDPHIHGNQNTAFSYAREIRLAICGVFYISRSLTSVLQIHYGRMTSNEAKENKELMALIERVANLPKVMLPDEYKLKLPVIESRENYLLISFGASTTPKIPYQSVTFTTLTTTDGDSNAYQMPYLDMVAKHD